MAPAPVVQFIHFNANDRCLADPSLFQALRDMAQQGWQEKGLKAQYWGTSANRVKEFYWLLLWQSYEDAIAIQADPSYPTIVQQRDALATQPVYEVHVRPSGNPLRAIQAPVTEVDFYKTVDEKVNPEAMPAAETQEMIRRLTYRIESLQSSGFIAISWGIALEDATRGVNFSGWRSIEDHMRMGTLDEHKVFVEESEEIFKSLTDLSVSHVHFKSHNAVSSA